MNPDGIENVSKAVVVQNSEPSVHCIDVRSHADERVLRIRPHAASGGVQIDVPNGPACVLNADEFDELLGALCRVQIAQQREMEALRDA